MQHCGRFLPAPITRREMLQRAAGGFGSIALAGLMAGDSSGAALRPPQYPAKAKSVVFLYMDGGVSQVDSFDPKPLLESQHGKPFPSKIEPTQFNEVGTTLACPWKFRNYGQSGTPVSDLFPHIGRCADKLCVVRSMVSEFSEHNTANYFLHTGFSQAGRPSMGAWLSYGLGSECQDLPTFAVINGGLVPSGGPENFAAGFLPALHQATMFKPQDLPIANLRSPVKSPRESVMRQRALLRDIDRLAAQQIGPADAIESAIANYELAYRMQTAVPDIADLSGESEHVREAYGLNHKNEPTQVFGRECLLARRMVERGVRFIELTCPHTGNDRWDAHGDIVKNHGENALATDQPIAAMINDLDDRGLLDETLIVWTGEFGRTPFAQRSAGRDHSPFGFSIFMAGGGVKPGTVYGATDEFGYRVVENRVTIHDLHATMLHLLGFDHEKLTYRYGGRDMRLTDVHGEVVHDLLA